MDNKKRFEDEVNYKRVLKNPISWFGLVYPMLIFVIVIAGIYYVDSLDEVAENNVEAVVLPEFNKELEAKKGSVQEGVDITRISKPADDMVQKGQDLYQSNCASCHGDEGKGDGPAGAGLNPPPRNFNEEGGWKNGRDLAGMYTTLQEGIEGSAMAAYEYMPVADKFAIIHYIHQELMGGEYPENTKEELQSLDQKYNLAAGTKTANQIPVDSAVKFLDREHQGAVQAIQTKLDYMKAHSFEEGYSIFENVTNDKFKALKTLSETKLWIENVNDFNEIIAASVPFNGFNTNALNLPEDKLLKLRDYLTKLFG